MRGERWLRETRRRRAVGSSPHARGTRHLLRRKEAQRRIIPACAGNAARPSGAGPAASDHPRMRGERADGARGDDRRAGSSPHARGTRVVSLKPRRIGRIIPACAGNACPCTRRRRARTDHPRMRGERTTASSRRAGVVGSSPHARGTRGQSWWSTRSRRIIPACAGNAVHSMPRWESRTDHPRMRGERVEMQNRPNYLGGSSPHARGTHFLVN